MKKNILILTTSLACGGAERSASLLANELVKSELYNVFIFSLSSKAIYYSLNDQIQVHFVDEKLKWVNKVQKNYKRVEYLCNQALSLNIHLIVGYTYIGGIISCLISRKTGIKNIICERSDPNRVSYIAKIVRRLVYKWADGAIFQTKEAYSCMSGIIKNGCIIPNAINVEILPEIVSFSKRKNVIVSVGHLERVKNHKMLIDAFSIAAKTHDDYCLEIYGDGSLRHELYAYIQKLGLTNSVFLMGNSNQIFEDIKTAKIFVLTSNYEGFPNALLEAMAMGLAVISTDCPSGGPRALIKNGFNGFLVRVGDSNELANNLIACFESSELDIIGMRASLTRSSHNSSKIMSSWIKYIHEILDI